MTIFIIFGLNIVYYLAGLYESTQGWRLITNSHYVLIYLGIMYVLISFIPQTILYIIPATLIVLAYFICDYATYADEYAFNEIFLSYQSFGCMVMMILPIQLNLKFGCFLLGMVYINVQFYLVYGSIKVELVTHSAISVIYYYVSSVILYNKVRELYGLIVNNETLVKELKFLIETFPEAVLIRHRKYETGEEVYSANHNFDMNVCDTQKQLEKLCQIEVELKSSDKFNHELNLIKMGLDEFLAFQEQKVHNMNEVACENVFIKLAQNEMHHNQREQGNDHNPLHYFSIKTLMLDWEGKKSFMHLFIDTTNIIQLEQATSNIKLQKIMFASSSHEFRTPLNAILNSFMLIDNNF